MASVSVSGAQLDVVERGQGTPLLFVHGSASDRRSWQGQLDAFGARRAVVLPLLVFSSTARRKETLLVLKST